MRTIAISEFKAHALKVLDEVEKTREIIIITKRGKPIANVIPHRKTDADNVPGKLSDTFVYEKDIVTPFGEELWDACR